MANRNNDAIQEVYKAPIFLFTFLRLWGPPGTLHSQASVQRIREKMAVWDEKHPWVPTAPASHIPASLPTVLVPAPAAPASQVPASLAKVPVLAPALSPPPPRPLTRPSAPEVSQIIQDIIKSRRPTGQAPLPSKRYVDDAADADAGSGESSKAGNTRSASKKKGRAPVVKGNKRNTTRCTFCEKHDYECWRQGGPSPRGSCYECGRAKYKCPSTQAFFEEIKKERKLESRSKVKPVSGQTMKPGPKATPAAKATKATKPGPAAASRLSKAKKSDKSPAVVPSSEDESVRAPRQKGIFQGKRRPQHVSFAHLRLCTPITY